MRETELCILKGFCGQQALMTKLAPPPNYYLDNRPFLMRYRAVSREINVREIFVEFLNASLASNLL